jgi:methylenetetrahydrofolate dehydrogenase (NADP+)/methenyltetrahydrofolate cyclohydrolase
MILLGRPVADAIETQLKQKIADLKTKNIKPYLAVLLIGDDPASVLYTRKKKEKAESLGIGYRLYKTPATVSEEVVLTLINDLNKNKNVHGIVVQLPLPAGYDTAKILSEIEKGKDVDGLKDGLGQSERVEFYPPAAGAILEILNFYQIDLKDKKVVLVGRGKLVGEPLEKIFLKQNIDLTVCDSKTLNLKPITLSADVIISGVGKPGLITAEMVLPQTIIIDAGTAESNGSTIGDVSPSVYEKVASYSPVPGGVGPVTVVKLLKNVVESAESSE